MGTAAERNGKADPRYGHCARPKDVREVVDDLGDVPRLPKVFTTGAVARICRVAHRTVHKWFDSGRLKGYRIPGSQDRRIPRADLIRFLKEHGLPLGHLAGCGTVVLVALGGDVARVLGGMLLGADVRPAADLFDAGLAVAETEPDAVVVDLSVGRSQACRLAAKVRAVRPDAALAALCGEDETDAEGLRRLGFEAVFVAPVDPAAVAEFVRSRLGG